MSKEFPITVSSWTLGDQCKFEERVKAAKEAGYDGIGLRAETYVDALNEGLHDEDILAILEKDQEIIIATNGFNAPQWLNIYCTIAFWIAAVVTLLSGIKYALDGWHYIKTK